MTNHRYCKICKDYFSAGIFPSHMKQHNMTMNSDAVEHTQYTGVLEKKSEDYMICVLHQKKITNGKCQIKNCNFIPFGLIRKSYMMNCIKGIIKNKDYQRVAPFFPHTDINTGKDMMIPIDMETKTVTIMGVPIFLRI